MPRPSPAFRTGADLVRRLGDAAPLFGVELRPPRTDAARSSGVERWIDLYHAVRRLTGEDTVVFTTDNAVGAREEESLRHLRANLGGDADLSRVVPFLTVKHPLEYCLRFPERALDAGHRALVVLGGDRHDGVARCVPHAADLRQQLRQRFPSLALGGWANPYRDPAWQVDLLAAGRDSTDFILTQTVSHHDLGPVAAFAAALDQAGLLDRTMFGVFYYRSAKKSTLAALQGLIPVPEAGLEREFGGEGLGPDEVCLRTLAALQAIGVRRFYLCNLPPTAAVPVFTRMRGALAAGPGGKAGSAPLVPGLPGRL